MDIRTLSDRLVAISIISCHLRIICNCSVQDLQVALSTPHSLVFSKVLAEIGVTSIMSIRAKESQAD